MGTGVAWWRKGMRKDTRANLAHSVMWHQDDHSWCWRGEQRAGPEGHFMSHRGDWPAKESQWSLSSRRILGRLLWLHLWNKLGRGHADYRSSGKHQLWPEHRQWWWNKDADRPERPLGERIGDVWEHNSRLRTMKKVSLLLTITRSYNLDTTVLKIRFQLEAMWCILWCDCYSKN